MKISAKKSWVRWAATAGIAGLLLTGCASGSDDSSAEGDNGPLEVFAAASLADSFSELAEEFEEETGTEVIFNFNGSSSLVHQLKDGAPADIFASADEPNMDAAIEADLVDEPVLFATNTFVLVTPEDNPAGIESLEDVDGTNLVICEASVPCGNATRTIFEDADIPLNPVSEETAVTDVLGKVVSGQADAGLVYVTDAATADGIQTIEIENADLVINNYPIATLAESTHPDAQAFVDFILGERGQEVLEEAGFGTP